MRSVFIVCLCFLILLPSIIRPPKAHAILPALAAGAGTLLEGTVLEAAASAGVRWGAKQLGQKVAPRVIGYLAKKGVDLDFLNNKKFKRIARDTAEIILDGEDQAKFADATLLMKRESTEIEAARLKKWDKPEYSYVGDTPDPYKNTSLTLILKEDSDARSTAFARHFFNMYMTPVPYQQKTKLYFQGIVSGNYSPAIEIDTARYPSMNISFWNYYPVTGHFQPHLTTLSGQYYNSFQENFLAEANAFTAYEKYLAYAGTKVIQADSLYFPRGIDDVYVRPPGSDSQYPSVPSIPPKKIVIKVPDGEVGTEVDWDTKIDIDNIYNKYVFNYNTDIDIEINNYYTDKDKDVKNEDFEKDTTTTPKPGGGTGSGECCTEAFFPDQALYEAYKLSLYTALMAKLPIVEQLDKISARFRKEGDSTGKWEGAYITDSVLGRIPVIDPDFVNANKDTIHFYFKVGIWVTVLIFSYRKISEILSR